MIELVDELKIGIDSNISSSANCTELIKGGDLLGFNEFVKANKKIGVKSVLYAFELGHAEIMLSILKSVGTQIEKMDMTLLYKYAACYGDDRVLKKLKPYAIKFTDKEKESVLIVVARESRSRVFEYLVDKLGYITGVTTMVLNVATLHNNKRIVDFIISKKEGMSLNKVAQFAAINSDVNMVKHFVDAGANLNLAIKYASHEIKEELTQYGKMLKEKKLLEKQMLRLNGSTSSKGFKI